jgi:drug/metabolite transporter (DMT)-like permease
MIVLCIFYLHVVAAAYVFTKRWQETNTKEAIVAVGFMALVFFVGWSVATVILQFFIEREGLGKWFDRDAMALVLLTVLETVLYSTYFQRKKRASRQQKTPQSGI